MTFFFHTICQLFLWSPVCSQKNISIYSHFLFCLFLARHCVLFSQLLTSVTVIWRRSCLNSRFCGGSNVLSSPNKEDTDSLLRRVLLGGHVGSRLCRHPSSLLSAARLWPASLVREKKVSRAARGPFLGFEHILMKCTSILMSWAFTWSAPPRTDGTRIQQIPYMVSEERWMGQRLRSLGLLPKQKRSILRTNKIKVLSN